MSAGAIDDAEFAFDDLKQKFVAAKTKEELYELVVNEPFRHKIEAASLFLGIMVFLVVDKKTGTINRVALSDTELAKNTTHVSAVPFKRIKIPLNQPENSIAEAVRSGQPQTTTDWKTLFNPALTPEQARINQASAGIAFSEIYPLRAGDGAAIIFSYYQHDGGLNDAQREFMKKYCWLVATTLEDLC